MYEAFEEHHVVHLLIAELKKMTAGDERFDAKFTESTFRPSRPDPENRKAKSKVPLTQPRLQEGGYGNDTEDRPTAVIGIYD